LIALFCELRAEGHAIVAVTHDREFARATGAVEWRMPDRRQLVDAASGPS
jgi:ABC-type lipoprotein export system ATPase subunit